MLAYLILKPFAYQHLLRGVELCELQLHQNLRPSPHVGIFDHKIPSTPFTMWRILSPNCMKTHQHSKDVRNFEFKLPSAPPERWRILRIAFLYDSLHTTCYKMAVRRS